MPSCSNCGHNDVECLSLRPPDAPADSHSVSSSAPPQLRAQLDKVKSTILRHKECLNTLKLAALRQQMYLEALDRQKRELQMELAHIVYPVLTLPPENHFSNFRGICRQWREIAISSPELWASVDLYFPSEKRVEDNGPLPLLNVCFSRAKRRLLPVTIRTNYNDIPRLLLSLLSSVAARLHTVELSLSQKDFQYLARDNIEFPNLKRLALVAYKDRTAPDYDPLSIFGNAPSLADLNVQSQPRDAILDTYPLLTSIELGYVHVHAVLAMLHRYPRLLHFTAQIKHDGSAHRGDQPLLVPRLESLVIYGPDIDFLSAPNLRRLEFDTGWRGPVFSTLLPFLARSSCILDHLSFNIQHEDSESDFLACLKAVPALSSLQIDVCKDDRFIRMINCDPPVVPQLQMLQISASYEKFDYLAFTQLLQLRRDDIGPLTQLHSVQLELEENEPDYAIDEDSWLPESVTIEFDKLVAGGLKLRVTLDDRYVWSKGGDIDVCEDFP